MLFHKFICGLVVFGITTLVYADVQVVDYSRPLTPNAPNAAVQPQPAAESSLPQFSDQTQNIALVPSLTPEQRLAKLEQQINNFNQQNFTKRLEDLQQQVQKLSGEVEIQAHALQQLSDQLKSFYQDLNQRLVKPEAKVEVKTSGKSIAKSTSPNAPAASPVVGDAIDLQEQKAYQSAFDLLQNKKNQEAAAGFRAYIVSYPNGSFTANAHYWLGEIYFANKQFKQAITEFEMVVNKYAKSSKVPDALFKLSLIYDQTGKNDLAKKKLDLLQKRYPHSTAAQLAKQPE